MCEGIVKSNYHGVGFKLEGGNLEEHTRISQKRNWDS